MNVLVPLANLTPWNFVETEFDGLLLLDETRTPGDARPAPSGVAARYSSDAGGGRPVQISTRSWGSGPQSTLAHQRLLPSREPTTLAVPIMGRVSTGDLLHSPLDFSADEPIQVAGGGLRGCSGPGSCRCFRSSYDGIREQRIETRIDHRDRVRTHREGSFAKISDRAGSENADLGGFVGWPSASSQSVSESVADRLP